MQKPLISFDYAIKYCLRDKGDYSVVEAFISTLLHTVGYKKNIKIIALLESESNQETKKDKRSLADVVVEDEEKNKYIIEIERNVKDTFLHKACFNASRLISDSLAQRSDYTQIVKIFHISLLYFPLDQGIIYHGQTLIHDIETQKKLTIHFKCKDTKKIIDATGILPEYFFISVPNFNNILEKEIDQWLYVMKNDEVPENFVSPYMKLVAEKLSVLRMSKNEFYEYTQYQKKIYNDRDELEAAEKKGLEKGLEKGREEGLEKGREEEKIEIAKNLISLGLDVEIIKKSTGLSKAEIEKLKN